MSRRFAASCLCTLALLVHPWAIVPAYADPQSDRARADALFESGKQLVEKRDYAAGCRNLEESLALYRGLATMLWLGDCFDKVGRSASAYRIFRDAALLAAEKKDPREGVAKARAMTLETKVARLVVSVTKPPADLVISRNGKDVPAAEWGVAVPVDPGFITVQATRPGHVAFEQQVSIPLSASVIRIEIPTLAPSPGSTAAATTPPPTPPPASDTPAPRGASVGSTQRVLGWVGIGIGVAGVGVGTYFGFRASAKNDDSNQAGRCDANDTCTKEGLGLRAEANDAALVSTIAISAGAALIVGGVILLVTAPSRRSTALLLPTPRGALLSGSF